jgi:hypothetical protein
VHVGSSREQAAKGGQFAQSLELWLSKSGMLKPVARVSRSLVGSGPRQADRKPRGVSHDGRNPRT